MRLGILSRFPLEKPRPDPFGAKDCDSHHQGICRKYLRTERDDELFALYASFEVILNQLGIEDWYAPIEYEDLDPPAKALVDALNLEAMLDDQLSRPEVDVRYTRFILRRLGQLQRAEIAEKILTSIDSLYPVFTEVVSYFKRSEKPYLALSELRSAKGSWIFWIVRLLHTWSITVWGF